LKKKRLCFYNPKLNIEKLFTEDSPEFRSIRGRLPKLPFIEEIKDISEFIRIFRSDVDEESLMWHRDREDEATHQMNLEIKIKKLF
jgi:hypothetical protein